MAICHLSRSVDRRRFQQRDCFRAAHSKQQTHERTARWEYLPSGWLWVRGRSGVRPFPGFFNRAYGRIPMSTNRVLLFLNDPEAAEIARTRRRQRVIRDRHESRLPSVDSLKATRAFGGSSRKLC